MEKVLLINYDVDSLELYSSLLAGYEIQTHPASTIQEAFNMLVESKYSGIVINGDNFEYLPFLQVMRALTYAPLGVSVSRYDKDEHDAAVENGADLYRARYDDHKHRVRNFSNVVKIYLALSKWQNGELSEITYGDIRILPDTRMVLVQNKVVELGRYEFDILCCLITNKGRILTYEQIYRNVWGEDYADSSRETLWEHMSKLRKKLRTEANLPNIIKTKYGVGYSVDR